MSESAWTCPKCNREFKNPEQYHSCLVTGVDGHFTKRPQELRETFDDLLIALKERCEFEVEAVKTMILLRGQSTFTSVKVEKESLKIGFSMRTVLNNPRLMDSVQYTPHTVESFVRISSPDEVDEELIAWLVDACEMSA